jgi:hypothetical protein
MLTTPAPALPPPEPASLQHTSSKNAQQGVAVGRTPLLRGASAAVVGDFVPAASTTAESARKLVTEYLSACALESAAPALLLDAPQLVCDGDWPVAPGDYCAQTGWSAVHLRRRAVLVLLLGAWWLLLAAGAGGRRQ